MAWDKTPASTDIEGSVDEKGINISNIGDQGTGPFSIDKTWRLGHLSAAQYVAILDFIKKQVDSKLISNPRILAMDDEESSISVGTTVPIPVLQRGGAGKEDMISFEYKEINVQLNVSPHLGRNNEIIMYVNPVIEEILEWVTYGVQRAPVTAKRSVNSIITVKNGETVVIGGLIKNQKTLTTKRVWLLGNLPLIGPLFQHKSYDDKQTDLMIFITPTIVQG
jgi:general secretion pathway protein D